MSAKKRHKHRFPFRAEPEMFEQLRELSFAKRTSINQEIDLAVRLHLARSVIALADGSEVSHQAGTKASEDFAVLSRIAYDGLTDIDRANSLGLSLN